MDPTTRVLVDPQPVLEAMTVCDSYLKNRRKKFRDITDTSICNREKAGTLLEDVVYMLSRTRDADEERVIIKAAPGAVEGIDIFDAKFPDVDWMFIYDDPSAAIGAQMSKNRPERSNCVKTKTDPQPQLLEVIKKTGLNIDSISLPQY